MKKYVIRLAVFCALIFAANSMSAQLENTSSWTHTISPETEIKAGDVITLTSTAEIVKGHHIYCAKQPADVVLPAVCTLEESSKGAELDGPLEDIGESHTVFDDIFEADIAYFDGKATFSQKIKISDPSIPLTGYIDFQICNDELCIPAKAEFSFELD